MPAPRPDLRSSARPPSRRVPGRRVHRSLSCLLALAAGGLAGCDDDGASPDGALADSGAPPGDAGDEGSLDAGRLDAGPAGACTYPTGAVEPMEVGSVLWPYRWPEAIDGAGRNVPLDLVEASCDTDDEIDWSPFDVLVFIAIPAW